MKEKFKHNLIVQKWSYSIRITDQDIVYTSEYRLYALKPSKNPMGKVYMKESVNAQW